MQFVLPGTTSLGLFIAAARVSSQLSSLSSSGHGVPFPLSRSAFRLTRNTAHLVLQ